MSQRVSRLTKQQWETKVFVFTINLLYTIGVGWSWLRSKGYVEHFCVNSCKMFLLYKKGPLYWGLNGRYLQLQKHSFWRFLVTGGIFVDGIQWSDVHPPVHPFFYRTIVSFMNSEVFPIDHFCNIHLKNFIIYNCYICLYFYYGIYWVFQ